MIHLRDWIMLGLMLGSMAVSFIWPRAGAPFKPYPTYFMMGLLFMSFLSISTRSIARAARESGPRLLGWLLLKLVAVPVALFFLLRALYPEFALAALLLGGISTGVVAPFFSTLLGGNTSLVVLMVTTSSILVPFTLPALVSILAGRTIDISLIDMARILAQVIFVPLVAAEVVRSVFPTVTEKIVAIRYPLSLVLCVLIILGVFSRYADYLHSNPAILVDALLASFALAVLLFAAGVLVSLGKPAAERLAVVISMGLMNNILVVVFSSRFFGPIEPLVAMIYCIPFFCSIIFLRAYAGLLARGISAPDGFSKVRSKP
jgi:BASS family bile acid:Na+ symporter